MVNLLVLLLMSYHLRAMVDRFANEQTLSLDLVSPSENIKLSLTHLLTFRDSSQVHGTVECCKTRGTTSLCLQVSTLPGSLHAAS